MFILSKTSLNLLEKLTSVSHHDLAQYFLNTSLYGKSNNIFLVFVTQKEVKMLLF